MCFTPALTACEMASRDCFASYSPASAPLKPLEKYFAQTAYEPRGARICALTIGVDERSVCPFEG